MTPSPAPTSRAVPPRKSSGLRLLARVAIWLVVAYACWCGALWYKQTDLVFPRSFANSQPLLPSVPEGAQAWWHDADGARVEAWFFLGQGRSPEAPGPAAMLFHGNGETIDNWVKAGLVAQYTQRGISVLLPEYRGYGRSTGTPSQRALAKDMLHWHTKLLERSEVRSEQVFYHGRSLGGGVAADLAQARAPAAIILDCTFTSVASFAGQYKVPGFIVSSPFRTDEVLPGLSCPVLVVHGRDDTIIPFEHGRTLAGLAKNATFIELPGGHLDFPGDQATYDTARWRFLKGAGLLPE